jgi:hypothetical protein
MPTLWPTSAGKDTVFKVESNMTLGGFGSVESFTADHQTAVEKAISEEVGQSVTVTNVENAAAGVVVIYNIDALSSPAAAKQVLGDLNDISANASAFVIIVVQKFAAEGTTTPDKFSVTAAVAVEVVDEVNDWEFFYNGEWRACGKGKQPNSRKDDCEHCLEGAYSTAVSVCKECPSGYTSTPSRATCKKGYSAPVYKQVSARTVREQPHAILHPDGASCFGW